MSFVDMRDSGYLFVHRRHTEIVQLAPTRRKQKTSIMKTFPAATGVGRELFKASMIAVFVLPERGLDVLHTWGQRIESRQMLGHIEWQRLDDMGMTPEDGARESAKPFWRA